MNNNIKANVDEIHNVLAGANASVNISNHIATLIINSFNGKKTKFHISLRLDTFLFKEKLFTKFSQALRG